jgi:hypothetical protein
MKVLLDKELLKITINEIGRLTGVRSEDVLSTLHSIL